MSGPQFDWLGGIMFSTECNSQVPEVKIPLNPIFLKTFACIMIGQFRPHPHEARAFPIRSPPPLVSRNICVHTKPTQNDVVYTPDQYVAL